MVRGSASERHARLCVAFAATNDANEIHRTVLLLWIKRRAPRPSPPIVCAARRSLMPLPCLVLTTRHLRRTSAAAHACSTQTSTHTPNSFPAYRSAGPVAHFVSRRTTALAASRLSKADGASFTADQNFGARRLLALATDYLQFRARH